MKKCLIILIALITIYPVFSKQTDENGFKSETLFDGKEIKSGGYGGPELKMTQINGDLGLMVGGRGGWIINSSISIGGGGYGLTTNHNINDTTKLDFGYGGLFLEYINNSSSLLHFTVNSLIGFGGAAYRVNYKFNNFGNSDAYNAEATSFFVFEPGVTADLNVTSFFRLSLGASYRLVAITGNELSKTKNSDLSGASLNIAFKFGKF